MVLLPLAQRIVAALYQRRNPDGSELTLQEAWSGPRSATRLLRHGEAEVR